MSYQQAEHLVAAFNSFLAKVEPLTERFRDAPIPESFDQIDEAAMPLQELIVGSLYLVDDENLARVVRRCVAGLCRSVDSGTATLGAYAILHILYAAGVALTLRSDFDGVDALLREQLSPFSLDCAACEYGDLSDIFGDKNRQIGLLSRVHKNVASAVKKCCPAEDFERAYFIFEIYSALEKLRGQSRRNGSLSRPVMLVAKKDIRFELAKLLFGTDGMLKERSMSGFVDDGTRKTAWGIIVSEGQLSL